MPLNLSGLISTSCAGQGLAADQTASANSRTEERRGFIVGWRWVALERTTGLSRLPERAPESRGRPCRDRIRQVESAGYKGVGRDRRPGAQIGGGLNKIAHLRLALELNDKLVARVNDWRKHCQARGCGREREELLHAAARRGV